MSQSISDLIPSATKVVQRLDEIERERRYLQRLLNIIRDRAKDRANAKDQSEGVKA